MLTLLRHEPKALIFRKLVGKAVGGWKKKINPILFAKSVGGCGNIGTEISKSHAGNPTVTFPTVTFPQAELKTVWSVL